MRSFEERLGRLSCYVIGVPKTINNYVCNTQVETLFGLDSTSKLYANVIVNLGDDATSTRKMYLLIHTMSRTKP